MCSQKLERTIKTVTAFFESVELTVYPRYSNGFEKNSKQHGIASGVSIQKVEKIKTALRTGSQPNNKIKGKKACDKNLSMSANSWKLVTQSCYDRFRTTKLKKNIKCCLRYLILKFAKTEIGKTVHSLIYGDNFIEFR